MTQMVDTHTHPVVKFGGVERQVDAEITEQHPDERVAGKNPGRISRAAVVTFHNLSDSTGRVSVQWDWEPEGLIEEKGTEYGTQQGTWQGELSN